MASLPQRLQVVLVRAKIQYQYDCIEESRSFATSYLLIYKTMNKFKEQLKTTSWKLSTSEKSHMRTVLRKTMAKHPAAGGVISSWQWWHISPRLASFSSGAVMALIILMGETAYAAQGSLPGDLLYPVKIHVTEPVQLALAATSEQKAQVNADIASQRVVEAQTLAAQGKLTATTTQELQDNFNEHATEAIVLANKVKPV